MNHEPKSNACRHLLVQFFRQNKAHAALLAGLCFAGALLPSLTPLVYRQIVDRLIPNRDFFSLSVYVAILIAIPCLTSLLLNWRNIAAHRLSDSITRTLRLSLFRKITGMHYGAYLRFGVASLGYRLTRACGQVGDVFLNTLLSCVNAAFSLILVLTPMMVLEYRLALAVFLAFPMVYALLAWVKKRVAVRDRKLFQTLMDGERLFQEVLAGLRMMRLSGGTARQTAQMEGWLAEHAAVKLDSVKAHEFERASLPELCLQVLYGLIFILGALLVMTETMSLGVLVAFVAYIPRAFSSIKELLLIRVTLQSVEPVFQSIDEVLAAPDEPSGLVLPASATVTIAFRNVCFSYDDQAGFALHDLNFEIRQKEAVAIVGETGGGKSTLLELLLRFYEPSAGEILLDGVDIREFELQTYRELFSVVQQNQFLWSDTLQNNVIYPAGSPDGDAYDRALEDARLTGFVSSLPQGDQTLLGECGQSVSGGERQRISLAHAFYRNRQILLLDEPTSALDAETEAAIRDVLLSQKGSKTILAVTHRLSTILQFDRVLVLQNGKIVEQGAPEALLRRPGPFHQLCRQQRLVSD